MEHRRREGLDDRTSSDRFIRGSAMPPLSQTHFMMAEKAALRCVGRFVFLSRQRTDPGCRTLAKETINKTLENFDVTGETDFLLYYFNGVLSIILVLLGGLFAGLTLAWVRSQRTDCSKLINF